MKGEIKLTHGGSDCSCKNIGIDGATLKLSDLFSMLMKAQELSISKVCIRDYQFNSLMESIQNFMIHP
jgi:hypothetical protein